MKQPGTEMKEYLLVTAHPELTDRVKSMGPTAGEAWRKSQHRGNIVALARKIEKTVLQKHGGEIVQDGSGYGVRGNPGEFNDMISVKTTEAGLAALKKIPEIGRISETIDFNKLLPAAPGQTNVPPGVCWTRPSRRR